MVTSDDVPEVTRLIESFEHRYPQCRMLYLRFDIVSYFGPLRRDEVDIWLTWWPGTFPSQRPEDGLRSGPAITRRGRVLLVGREHPLAARTSISLNDLTDHPVITMTADQPTVFQDGWIPTTAPNGKPVATVDQPWHGHFQELVHILERDEYGWLTHTSIRECVSLPDTVVAVPVCDASPFALLPLWRVAAETATTRAFAAMITKLGRT